MTAQTDLFGTATRLPTGLRYQADFLSEREEASLVAAIQTLPLTNAQYKQYTARRRTVSYGSQYDFSDNTMRVAPAIPQFLYSLRAQIATWIGIAPDLLVHALVAEYSPGAPLGWHRDVPQFEIIVGVSLGGDCVMRLRPYRPNGPNLRQDVISLSLEPRSVYSIRDEARWQWQHSIAAPKALRYSITLRTSRGVHA